MHLHTFTLICTHIGSFFKWEVKCKVCELFDMIWFASFRAQKMQRHLDVLCLVTLFDALYRWHGTYAFFLVFHFADDMAVCVLWVCPTTPMSSAGTIHMCTYVGAFDCVCTPFCRKNSALRRSENNPPVWVVVSCPLSWSSIRSGCQWLRGRRAPAQMPGSWSQPQRATEPTCRPSCPKNPWKAKKNHGIQISSIIYQNVALSCF